MVASRLERRVFLEGMSQILRQPEFKDVQRLETLLFALEQRSAIYQMLHRAASQCDITILIGSENEFEPMQECSIIMTSYFIGSRCAGYLGVVGPTRMHYDRGVAAVELMAQNLSQMLTNFNLA
jgi:heat-inducible transcriptional repressor